MSVPPTHEVTELLQAWSTGDESALEKLRRGFTKGGERGYWQTQLEFLKADSKQSPADSYSLALLYARVGDQNRNFQCLEKAFQEHSQNLTLWLLTEPAFDSIRTDPRFQDLLRRMGRTQ